MSEEGDAEAALQELEEDNYLGEGRAGAINAFENWKEDPGERARRICLCWKFIIVKMSFFPCFAEAFRTVTATQV